MTNVFIYMESDVGLQYVEVRYSWKTESQEHEVSSKCIHLYEFYIRVRYYCKSYGDIVIGYVWFIHG